MLSQRKVTWVYGPLFFGLPMAVWTMLDRWREGHGDASVGALWLLTVISAFLWYLTGALFGWLLIRLIGIVYGRPPFQR